MTGQDRDQAPENAPLLCVHVDNLSIVDLTKAEIGSRPFDLPVVECPGCGRHGDTSGDGTHRTVVHRLIRVDRHTQTALDFCFLDPESGEWCNRSVCATESLAAVGLSLIPSKPGLN